MVRFGEVSFVSGLLVAILLAGCLTPAPERDPAAALSERTERATVDGFQPNMFLLDLERPHVTRIGSGSEPDIVAGDHGWTFIGHTGGVHRSRDNGATWFGTNLPFKAPVNCDGYSIDENDAGVWYVAATACATISFAKSTTNGASWDTVTQVTGQVVDASGIADRPWVAAGPGEKVAIVFFDFGRTFSETCLQSTTGGLAFTDRGVFFAPPNAGNIVYDDAGALYYAEDRTLHRWGALCRNSPSALNLWPAVGPQVFTRVASNGEAVYAAAPTANNQQILVAGTDDFDTIKSIALSRPELQSNTFMDVAAQGDDVAVAWYGSETAGNPNNANFAGSWNVFVALIKDFWSAAPAVTYYRVTDAPNHVGDICMDGTGCGGGDDRDLLDYFGIDFGPDGHLHIAYVDDEIGNAAVYYGHIEPGVTPGLPG